MQAVTDATFEADVLAAAVPVLVGFWAPWCGPCRTIAPLLDEFDRELGEHLRVVSIDVDDNSEVAGALGIRSIPTLVVSKEGRAVEGAIGALSKAELRDLVLPHLSVNGDATRD